MRLLINSKNGKVSKQLRERIEKKAGKLERYFLEDADVHITLSEEDYLKVAEMTVAMKGYVLRAEEKSTDMFNSVDRMLEKAEAQIHKHKKKLIKRFKQDAFDYNDLLYQEAIEETNEPRIVRTKKFAIKPMSVEEAALQIDLLGHDFFVFTDANTFEVNVLYKRKDGNLGLIEPQFN